MKHLFIIIRQPNQPVWKTADIVRVLICSVGNFKDSQLYSMHLSISLYIENGIIGVTKLCYHSYMSQIRTWQMLTEHILYTESWVYFGVIVIRLTKWMDMEKIDRYRDRYALNTLYI